MKDNNDISLYIDGLQNLIKLEENFLKNFKPVDIEKIIIIIIIIRFALPNF